MSTPRRGPGPNVRFPPPFVFVATYVIGWLLERYVAHSWPPAISRAAMQTVDVLGVVFILAGLALAFWGIVTFNRLRTAVYPNRDASTLVIQGPYRYSRNPMYSGMTMAYVGVSWLSRLLWPIWLLPLALGALYLLVIRKEERHLTETFGDQYRAYQAKVGRWI